MPSASQSNKSASWFVRVDGPQSFLQERCEALCNAVDTSRILALFHKGEKGDNPHCHFTIQTLLVIQQQSFSARIKKLFEIQHKSAFAIKVWDNSESAHSYMFHEQDEVILSNKGYTEDDLTRFRKMNAEVQKVVQINKARAPGRCVEKIIEDYAKEQYVPTRADVITKILEMIRDGEIYEPGSFQLEKYMEEVYLKTRPKAEWQEYVDARVASVLRKFNF